MRQTDATNMAGAPSFEYGSEEMELVMRAVSNFVETEERTADGVEITTTVAYGNLAALLKALLDLIRKVGARDPEFVLKLAAWLRDEMGMRSVSALILALMAGHRDHVGKPKPWVSEYGPEILRRLDDASETLAAFQALYGEDETIPKSLKRAIARRIERMNAYEALKYRREDKQWALRDVLRATNPRADSEARAFLFDFIVQGKHADERFVPHGKFNLADDRRTREGAVRLGVPEVELHFRIKEVKEAGLGIAALGDVDGSTWEALTSAFGSKPEVWERVADIMPMMAYHRNLVNIITKSKAEINIDKVVASAKKGTTLPYRYLVARRMVQGLTDHLGDPRLEHALDALDAAIEEATKNVPNLGRGAVLVDCSGSMEALISARSKANRSDVARVFAAAAAKRADTCILVDFNYEARRVVGWRRNDRLFSIVDALRGPLGVTSLAAALQHVEPHVMNLDYIYILTDENSWMPSFGQGAGTVLDRLLETNKKLKIIDHDLAGGGKTDAGNHPRILHLGGWNDNVFKVVELWGAGGNDAIVEAVRNYQPKSRQHAAAENIAADGD